MIYDMMRIPATIMQRLDNQLVVRMQGLPKLKSKVFDGSGKNVGKIVRIFGPVKSPYGLVAITKPVEGGEDLSIESKEV